MKPRVAFCMRGAVGKESGAFSKIGDLYNNSNYINYKQCYNSIIRHIIEPNREVYDIDIFQHCWNVDLEEELVSLYKPKSYIFEDNSKYNDEILKSCNSYNDFGGVSQALTIKKVLEIKEEYEKKYDFSYDIVILYRYDVLLWKDIILKTYANLSSSIYVNAHPNSDGDFHFIMNNYNSSRFKYLYDSFLKRNPHKLHYCIRNFVVNHLNLPLLMDSIEPGKHQEVLQKTNNFSIKPGYLTIEQFNSYRQ